jgi:hypothetical protein
MTHTIGPEHVVASAALPPGFPAVEIDGQHYWDGGSVSNTPAKSPPLFKKIYRGIGPKQITAENRDVEFS